MMDPIKLRVAIELIATMDVGGEPRRELERAVRMGEVAAEGWVLAALGCDDEDDMVAAACEFLLADCREGFVPESSDGSGVPEA